MTSPDKKIHLGKEHLSQLLYQMLRIRLFEERCAELYTQEKIRGFLHLYIGEEAIAVGVCQSLQNADRMVCTYREHGHALARGMSMTAVMAEMFGKTNGCSRGRGGSMHLFSDELNFYGGNAIVAGGLPLAVGLALADKKLQHDSVTCCFFGEGAVAEGEFHESLNLACLWQLPVLFICENNLYAMGTALERSESETELYRKAASYGMPAQSVDGMSVVDVEVAAKQALEAIRQGQGPQFLECCCYRFKGHSMFDTQLYRRKEEVDQWLSKGPVVQLSDWMEKNYHLSKQDIDVLKNKINLEIDQAVSEADQGEWEPVTDLLQGVYTEVDHD
ncbi:pyruvate dehydrogenase (acetyl-transferring) E1 component subunit alpha [Neptuniibacter sp. QD57_21]|uniref:pyruvate dehydrogenase (acetyl-transferring) E1 component subunit alpha n=1 Tax=Neptuniibacter sp. QD57_21 TaxID=3398213 RepID=UPI0039F4F60A